MKEWNVYADGRYLGTVHETTEEAGRAAAFSKFDIPEDADVSVSRR
ncbi:hypothetical protein ACV0PV_006158 [Pseudomonas aeruginosa]